MSSLNASHGLLPSATMRETNSAQSCNNSQLSLEEQMVLMGPFMMVGYRFKLKPQPSLSVTQFFTVPSL